MGITAADGKAAELEEFLKGGAALVEETEPQTVYWAALKFSETEFGIYDTFVNEQGVEAHMGGDVAITLSTRAEDLVEGGWEAGVMSNLMKLEIVANIADHDKHEAEDFVKGAIHVKMPSAAEVAPFVF